MSYAYRISDQEAAHFLTFQIVGWVDVFTRKIYRDIQNGETIIIEKVFDWEKKFLLKSEMPCLDGTLCLDTIGFSNRELFISYKNFQDKIIREKFRF